MRGAGIRCLEGTGKSDLLRKGVLLERTYTLGDYRWITAVTAVLG